MRFRFRQFGDFFGRNGDGFGFIFFGFTFGGLFVGVAIFGLSLLAVGIFLSVFSFGLAIFLGSVSVFGIAIFAMAIFGIAVFVAVFGVSVLAVFFVLSVGFFFGLFNNFGSFLSDWGFSRFGFNVVGHFELDKWISLERFDDEKFSDLGLKFHG